MPPKPAVLSTNNSRPDFVMVGVRDLRNQRCLVFASDTLDRAQLLAVAGHAMKYRLEMLMGSVVCDEGPDYRSALANLMAWWHPGAQSAPMKARRLPSPPRAIEAEDSERTEGAERRQLAEGPDDD